MQRCFYLLFLLFVLTLGGVSCDENVENKIQTVDVMINKNNPDGMGLPSKITNYQNTGVDFNNKNIALTKESDGATSTYLIEAINPYDHVSLKSILIIKNNIDGSCVIDHLTDDNILIARLFYDKDADLIDAEIPTDDIPETKGQSGWYGC